MFFNGLSLRCFKHLFKDVSRHKGSIRICLLTKKFREQTCEREIGQQLQFSKHMRAAYVCRETSRGSDFFQLL